MKPNAFYLTTPIYYVNAQPHIGHAYTTLAADAIARWHRLQGQEVFFLTGTDEHGAKIAEAAQTAGQSPKLFCDQIAGQFQKTWQNLNIAHNYFIRTTDAKHQAGVQFFLKLLKEKGDLYESDYQGLYCTPCENFITAKELTAEGFCPYHQKKPNIIKEKNWFFKLSKYLKIVKKLIETDKFKIEPLARKKEILGLLKQKLADFSVSRPNVSWGVPLPWDKTQTIYVWVDALLNYLTVFLPEDKIYKTCFQLKSAAWFKKFWPPDLQLMAKEIIKFHAIYWPAILLSLDLPLPKKIFVHGFFSINGQKMSKSLGNVINPTEMTDKFGLDATRYLILSQFTFGNDGDIKENNFVEKYNADLANGLGNLTARVITMTEKYFNSKAPQDQPSKSANQKTPEQIITQVWLDYKTAFNNLALDQCLKIIIDFTQKLDQYIQKTEPYKLIKQNRQKTAKVLYNLLESLRHIAWQIMPFMPNTANKIFEQLGILNSEPNKLLSEAQKWGGLQVGQKIGKKEILFQRI